MKLESQHHPTIKERLGQRDGSGLRESLFLPSQKYQYQECQAVLDCTGALAGTSPWTDKLVGVRMTYLFRLSRLICR